MGSPSVRDERVGELIDAAVRDRPKAERLLAMHPDLLHARWIHDETALHFLAIEYQPEAVRWLAEHGMDVNAVNAFGATALAEVVTLRNLSMVELLLDLGANPNVSSGHGTPLTQAIECGAVGLVRRLLAAGARFDSAEERENVRFALGGCGESRDEILALLVHQDPTFEA